MIIKSLTELEFVAQEFIRSLMSIPQNSEAKVVLLIGDLGSGKTTFVQKIAKNIGITEVVNSPTFVISKKYKLPKKHILNSIGIKFLIHIDAYRLSSENDLLNIGLEKELSNKDNLIFIEWGNLIEKFLKNKNMQKINFAYSGSEKRKVTFLQSLD